MKSVASEVVVREERWRRVQHEVVADGQRPPTVQVTDIHYIGKKQVITVIVKRNHGRHSARVTRVIFVSSGNCKTIQSLID